MSDLADFLLARIRADEHVARAATEAPWEPDDSGCCVYSPEVGTLAQVAIGGGDGSEADVTHIARHDPARVLAECAAKRRIVVHAIAFRERAEQETDLIRKTLGECAAETAEDMLPILAGIYADHPDYRDEWK